MRVIKGTVTEEQYEQIKNICGDSVECVSEGNITLQRETISNLKKVKAQIPSIFLVNYPNGYDGVIAWLMKIFFKSEDEFNQ